MLLGALPAPPAATASPGAATLSGAGDHARLDPAYTRTSPLPPRITDYATTGHLPANGTWRSHSEARQSVLAHAALHGHSLATIRALIAPGRPWHPGLAAAYTRYRHNADKALERDFTKALAWAAANSPKFPTSPCTRSRTTHTGGSSGFASSAELAGQRDRLAGHANTPGTATAGSALRSFKPWPSTPPDPARSSTEYPSSEWEDAHCRWPPACSARPLSGTSCAPSAIRPGAPLVRTRLAQGRDADFYALTRQNPAPTRRRSHRLGPRRRRPPRLESHRPPHRRIYELIVHRGLTNPHDICAAAHVSTSTGYTSLAALATAGLIRRGRGTVTSGSTSLDTIAAAHHLDDQRAERITRHQQQRATWHRWLAIRDAEHGLTTVDAVDAAAADQPTAAPASHEVEYLASVLTTGPPPTDEEAEILAMLSDILGARVVASAA